MNYKKFGDTMVVSLERGEEIQHCLKEIALKENITFAEVSGLGATDDFTVSVFDTETKNYYNHTYTGDHEITSLTGSITTMNGEYYAHLHMSAADSEHQVVGGHLNRCVISGVGEIFIRIIPGQVDRALNEKIGLNELVF